MSYGALIEGDACQQEGTSRSWQSFDYEKQSIWSEKGFMMVAYTFADMWSSLR